MEVDRRLSDVILDENRNEPRKVIDREFSFYKKLSFMSRVYFFVSKKRFYQIVFDFTKKLKKKSAAKILTSQIELEPIFDPKMTKK